MRKPIIAGNWKMHKTANEARSFIEAVQEKGNITDQVEAVICSPALYLAELVEKTKSHALEIGAQTMHEEAEGAFTGEMSASMLTSVGVKYAIIGHSERREYYNETDESVNRKVRSALKEEVTPIVCVGESLEERENGTTVEKVSGQVEKAFKDVSAEEAVKVVIAYEPIWAIGTGKTATADDANEVCGAIRSTVEKLYDESTANAIRIQYGGSVNPENIEELMSKEHIDGALVGGASLQPDSYLALVEAAQNA